MSTPSGLSRTWATSSLDADEARATSSLVVVTSVGISQPSCDRLKGSGSGGRVPMGSPGRFSQCRPITLHVSTPEELPSPS